MTPSRSFAAVLVLFACAAQPEPRPDDMSAAAHRREAARERDEARRSLAYHEQTGARLDPRVPGGGYEAIIPAEELRPDRVPADGGRWHLIAAEARAEHARRHEAAAAELERFEEDACGAVPVAERAGCPLLAGAAVVIDVAGGVEVRFEAGAPVDDVVRRMRCHHAYARTRGFAAEDAGCPLYVKGLRIEQTGKRVVRLVADDAAAVGAIRTGSRELTRPR